VSIGTQVWKTKNLDVANYRNGDAIPQVTDPAQWGNLTTGAWCWYNNDSATYGATYGRLYNWYAVNDPRGLAPAGWHVPTDGEWTTLTNYLGGISNAGCAMKETGTAHWQSANTGATNSSGFFGLPGGYRVSFIDSYFSSILGEGSWWSSEINKARTLSNYRTCDITSLFQFSAYGLSVRCVKD
jgi:uncharacterized protein (TIGR02145 family)